MFSPETHSSWWIKAVYSCILSAATLGGLLLFVCILKFPLASLLTNRLLQSQCVLDLSTCAMAFFTIFSTGLNFHANAFVCFLLMPQMPLWYCVCGSCFNQVLLAVDRFMAVCRPQRYRNKQTIKWLTIFIAALAVHGLLVASPIFLEASYVNATCRMDILLFSGVKHLVGHVWFVGVLLLPSTVHLSLYGAVVFRLVRNRNRVKGTSALPFSSDFVTRGSIRFTKVCILLALVNFVCIGVDAFHAELWALGVVPYQFGDTFQVFGAVLVSVNCLVNPLAYFLFLSSMRKRARDLFYYLLFPLTRRCNL